MRVMKSFVVLMILGMSGGAHAASTGAGHSPTVVLPSQASQGELVVGNAPPGSTVALNGKELRVSPEGRFVFGIGRDEVRDARVDVTLPDGRSERLDIAVKKRDWPVERVNGVPL
jgi:hypothetical protein